LKALAHVRSRLIITTNYGRAIETAAAACGIEYESISASQFAVAAGDREKLVVMHLHGRQDDPDGIVLTPESYDRALHDQRLRQFLRDTALRHRLVFLGQRLAHEEQHVIANVRWAVEAGASRHGPHLLVTSSVNPGDPERLREKARIESDARVMVLDTPDSEHEYMSTQQAISAIIPPASNETTDLAPPPPVAQDEPYYLAMPMAKASEVSSPGGRGAYMARTYQYGVLHLTDVVEKHSRVALVAPGGYGKSVELVHAGRVSVFPVLYAKLSGFRATPTGAAPESVFVANMADAQSLSLSCPAQKLTVDRLRNGSYLFVLDALDEVGADRAMGIGEQISTVAAMFPQHRWLVASRPIDALQSLDGFDAWSPMPASGWLTEYAASRNVPSDQLKAVFARAPQLIDLAEIPIYGAAIVDFTRADKTLPTLPIEIIWALNDDREAAEEQTFFAPREQVHVWLDRLALRQQLLATTETSSADVFGSAIADDLDQVAVSVELLTHLAVRALVTSAAGTVRFPTMLSQEARAARALRDAPADAGLRVLDEHVLVTLDAPGFDGRPVRRIRPGWRTLLEMVLPLLDTRRWTRIADVDPMITSRAMASVDDSDGKRTAAEHIWDHYANRRITLDPMFVGRANVSDREVFRRLLAGGATDTLIGKVRDAHTSTDHADRSNSLLACTFVLDADEALSNILDRVQDTNHVVRHYAALAAMDLQSTKADGPPEFTHLRSALLDQASVEGDKDVAATLLTAALLYAPVDQLLATTEKLDHPLAANAARIVMDRVPLNVVIDHLAAARSLSGPIGQELLKRLGGFARDIELDAIQTATLSTLAEQEPDPYGGSAGLRAAARADRVAFVVGKLVDAAPAWLDHTPYELLAGWTVDELTDLNTRLSASEPAWSDFGVTADQVDGQRLEQLLTVARRLYGLETVPRKKYAASEAASSATGAAEAAPPAPPTSAADRFVEIIASGALASLAGGADDRVAFQALFAAAAEDVPVPDNAWPDCLRILATRHDHRLPDWLSANWKPGYADVALDVIATRKPDDIAAVIAAIPGPWSEPFTTASLGALTAADQVNHAVVSAAGLIAERGAAGVLQGWADAHQRYEWLLPFLVVAGDEAAEAMLLAGLAQHPQSWRNQPISRQANWVPAVRHTTSAGAVLTAIRELLLAGEERSNVASLLDALRRVAGTRALPMIASLLDDAAVPKRPYLWYSWVEAADALAEKQAREGLAIVDVDALVNTVVPPP
jgi:hypothetical protein